MSNRQTTYYCDCRSIDSISNPTIDNNVGMKYGGFLSTDWDYLRRESYYGLKKTRSNQGVIFCDDASKLFSASSGGVEIIINLKYPIINGIYDPLLLSSNDFNEYLLWGVNVGKTDVGYPSIYLKLTKLGIEFTNWGAAGKFTLNGITSLPANEDIKIECLWGINSLENSAPYSFDAKMILKINDEVILMENIQTNNDSLENLNFCILDTPFTYSNLDCIIKNIYTSRETP